MDSSPLILVCSGKEIAGSFANKLQAQTHARSAIAATQIDPTAAIGEHNLAARQYSSASKATSNSEVSTFHRSAASISEFRIGCSHPKVIGAAPRQACRAY